ncbi:MAG: SDR family oxidoreductase [Thermoleophilaceae bacterium]
MTGASKGIGLGIARALSEEGAKVAVSSRSRERIDAAAEDIGATAFVHDSGDLDAAPALIGAVEDALGPLEVLITNTGGPPAGPDPLAFGVDQWQDAHRQLVLGPMALIEHALPAMCERGFGRVVGVGSSAVKEPIPNLMLSNAHRIGTVAAFKTLAAGAIADGVTLNTVLPGLTDTARLEELLGGPEGVVAAAQATPAGRLGTVEELAAAAVFLCSEQAAYITGTTVLVDGGRTQGI